MLYSSGHCDTIRKRGEEKKKRERRVCKIEIWQKREGNQMREKVTREENGRDERDEREKKEREEIGKID